MARLFVLALTLTLAIGAGVTATASATSKGKLVVTKGGDRTSTNTAQGSPSYAAPVAGALFEYTRGNPTVPATVWTAFSNPTAVNGRASENLSAGIYYVREKTPGPGFTNYGPVDNLRHDGSQPYVARVEVEKNRTTYAYPHTNTDSNPANWSPTRDGSNSDDGSPFINVRDNGALPPGCGTNILLVLDRSGSIDQYKETYKEAARSFVNSLNGTPTQIGITSFNDNINSYSPAVGNSNYYHSPLDLSVAGNAATLNSTIDNVYANPNDLTNWDGALDAAAQAKGFTPDAETGQSANPDIVVFITDGNPTTDEITDTSSSLIELTSGMASANLVKNQAGRTGYKTKMLAIGVGNGVTPANLKAVSGPVEGVDGDYATPTVAELQSFLKEFAAGQCGGQVYIRKHLAGDATNQADWGFKADDPRPGFNPTYLDDDRFTHASGNPPVIETGAFFMRLPGAATNVTISEDANGQPIDDFELTDAVCRYDSYDGQQTAPGNLNGLDYSLDVKRGDSIYCTFTNTPKAKLKVTKTPDNGTISAGDDAEFTIAVKSTGTTTAVGATLSDQLPAPGAGAWTVSQQPAGGTCSIDGSNLLSCSFGDIPGGQTKTLKVKTQTSYEKCGTYDNPIATASADNADSASDSGKIRCKKPNLSVTKTPDNGTINAGEDVVFTVQVDNAGPGTAKAVTLSDNLPGGVSGNWVEDPDSPDCSINAGVLDCDFGDLASGGSKSVTVKAPTDYDNCTVYDNTATVSSSNAPDVGDTGKVTCDKPGVGILKTAVQGSIDAGDSAQFSITVSNVGAGTATAVTLTDPLPGPVAGDWVISSQPNGDPCSITNAVLDCDFGDLAPSESRTVEVEAETDFERCGVLDNTATASAENAPKAEDEASINCDKPNLSVTKTPDNGTIDAGEDVVFTVQVDNAGPGTASSVSLSDLLPTGTAGPWAITTQPGGAPCVITDGTLNCAFGDLPAGESRTVTVNAATSSDSCGRYDNTATAIALNAPAVEDQAFVDCVTTPVIKPKLVLQKKANKRVARPGDKVRYTIRVKNTRKGSVAKNLKICDRLPRFMTVVSKGGRAFFENGKLCWKVKKLRYSKKGKSFSYVARVAGNAKRGAKLRNVVTLGKLKADHVVRVKAPRVKTTSRRPTPVTG